MVQLTMAKAITAGLSAAMARNEKVVAIGQDIGKLGGVFRITEACRTGSAPSASWTRRWPRPAS